MQMKWFMKQEDTKNPQMAACADTNFLKEGSKKLSTNKDYERKETPSTHKDKFDP